MKLIQLNYRLNGKIETVRMRVNSVATALKLKALLGDNCTIVIF